METTTPELTSAAAILAAYDSIAGSNEIMFMTGRDELLDDLAKLFISRPSKEILGCIQAKDYFLNLGLIRNANAWLESEFCTCAGGSSEEREILDKGVILVDVFMQSGEFEDANEWLVKAYDSYPQGSVEEKAVVEKSVTLADAFVRAGEFRIARGWLETACQMKLYPSGSKELNRLNKKLSQIKKRLRAFDSTGLGTVEAANIPALKVSVQRELAKIQSPADSVTLGGA